MTGEVTKAR